jgi:hypothetical protein
MKVGLIGTDWAMGVVGVYSLAAPFFVYMFIGGGL